MQYIIVKGNPVDGFKFEGPYPDRGDAMVQANELDRTDWWIAPLEPAVNEPDWRNGLSVGQTATELAGCEATMGGWTCTRHPGHDMPHVAGIGSTIAALWSGDHFEDKYTKGARP